MKTAAFLVCLTLAACESKAPAPDLATTMIADEFCAGNYEPWKVKLTACAAERNANASGAQCVMYDQIEAVLEQRRRTSGFSTCYFTLRWGPNAKNR